MSTNEDGWKQCPKCHMTSGNDWFQCSGKCPLEMSPHFDPAIAAPLVEVRPQWGS